MLCSHWQIGFALSPLMSSLARTIWLVTLGFFGRIRTDLLFRRCSFGVLPAWAKRLWPELLFERTIVPIILYLLLIQVSNKYVKSLPKQKKTGFWTADLLYYSSMKFIGSARVSKMHF